MINYKFYVWCKILIIFNNNINTVTKISKILDVSYSSINKVINIMEKDKFFKSNFIGRERLYYITEKGKLIKKYLMEIVTELNS